MCIYDSVFLQPVLLQFVLILGKISSLAFFFPLIIWSVKRRFTYLFTHFQLCFVAAHELSVVAVSRGCSSLRCMSVLWWFLVLLSTGSRHMGFSSCSVQAQQLQLVGSRSWAPQLWHTDFSCSMVCVTRIKLVSLALADGFFFFVRTENPLYFLQQ